MRKQKIEDEGIEVDDPDASGSWANFTGGFEKWIKMASGTLDYDLKGNTFTEETWK
jgi:predicted secreted protein